MSRVRNLLMTSAVRSPTRPHPVLPFSKTKSTTKTPDSGLSFYPFSISEVQSREWWWRFAALSCVVDYNGGTDLSPGPRSFTLFRKPLFPKPLLSEVDLNLPGFSRVDNSVTQLAGAFRYEGSDSFPGWNGDPDAQLGYSITLDLFAIGFPPSDVVTHAYWRTDTNSILPSFQFSCNISITTPGIESGASIAGADTAVGPSTTTTGSVLPLHGGGPKDFICYSADGVAVAGIDITPFLWMPYEGPQSTVPGPIWNLATGAREKQVFQQPM